MRFKVLFVCLFYTNNTNIQEQGVETDESLQKAVGYGPLRWLQRQKHQQEVHWESEHKEKEEIQRVIEYPELELTRKDHRLQRLLTAIKLFISECDRKEKRTL